MKANWQKNQQDHHMSTSRWFATGVFGRQTKSRRYWHLILLALFGLLSACGGGSSQGTANNGADSNTQPDQSNQAPNPPAAARPDLASSATRIDQARLLSQATFGPNTASLTRIQQFDRLEAWIDDQINQPISRQLPYVQANSNGSLRNTRHHIYWRNIIEGPDQLRQRMTLALSEIFVISDLDYTLGNAQYGMASYHDLLAENAFGNYRNLLEKVTLHPAMGVYLSMVRNEKADPQRNIRPDENYAREVMQLFSIGLHSLDADGHPQASAPAYSQKDVEELSRVLTGWNFAETDKWQSSDLTQFNKTDPMVPVDAYHDFQAKTIVGNTAIAADNSIQQDLAQALDTLFQHPNTPWYISKLLIQRLTSSNPSDAYLKRVADKFRDNGAGVRGDLTAVVKAILLDPEARDPQQSAQKLKEPILRHANLYRALNARPGPKTRDASYHPGSVSNDQFDTLTGQAILKSPSVFNFFSPTHSATLAEHDAQGRPIHAPELQILTEANVAATNNDLHQLIYEQSYRPEGSSSTQLDFNESVAFLHAGSKAYLDYLDLVFMSGTMPPAMRQLLQSHLANRVNDGNATVDDNTAALDEKLRSMPGETAEALNRDMLFSIVASPQYMVQP